MKTITKKWLKEKGACEEGFKWFISQEETEPGRVMLKLVGEGKAEDAYWLLENTMNKKQSVQLAVFSAHMCLDVFEKEFPNDDSPRKAIEAAEEYLKTPNAKTKEAARSAAWSAARSAESAARSAAWSAAWSAESAAWSAARSAAWSAARSAAWSAAWSAARSAARSAALKEAQLIIIKEAIKIMGWQE